jgi:hypothetical protein
MLRMAILKRHKAALIRDLASGEYTAKELAEKYRCQTVELRAFVDMYRAELEEVRHEMERIALLTDGDGLWVTSKKERLRRYQQVLEILLPAASTLDPMVIREIRSYLNDIADELGQLLNRGAGENNEDVMTNYTINGVDPKDLM